ncbi:MAG: LysR family transcriptional regulator [Rhodobacteraceae bacterium]|nr:LysR family transcriptional regulator [Paracoccaceae bacterium]
MAVIGFTLKQLRYVEAAGRFGSIAQAASELNISQSSITAAIDAIEARQGYALFVRTPAKGIRPTPSGVEALRMIRQFLDQAQHFESDLKSVHGDATGTVRIACYVTAAPSFLPVVLRSFARDFPGVSIQLLEGNMRTIMDFLLNGEADLVFTYDAGFIGKQHFEPLFGAPLFALLPVSDPLSERSAVSLSELASRPMVLLDLPQTRDYFMSVFDAAGARPNIVHSSRSSEIVRALVSGGFGFSVLNICPADYWTGVHRYRVLPISDPMHVPTFGIATQAGLRQPKIVRAFVQHCLALNAANAFRPLIVS